MRIVEFMEIYIYIYIWTGKEFPAMNIETLKIVAIGLILCGYSNVKTDVGKATNRDI